MHFPFFFSLFIHVATRELKTTHVLCVPFLLDRTGLEDWPGRPLRGRGWHDFLQALRPPTICILWTQWEFQKLWASACPSWFSTGSAVTLPFWASPCPELCVFSQKSCLLHTGKSGFCLKQQPASGLGSHMKKSSSPLSSQRRKGLQHLKLSSKSVDLYGIIFSSFEKFLDSK